MKYHTESTCMWCIKMYILHTDMTSQRYGVTYDKYKHCLQATSTGYRYRFTLDPVGTLSLTGYRYRFTLDPVGTLSLTGYRYRFTLHPVGTLSLTGYRYRFTLHPVGTLSLMGYQYRCLFNFICNGLQSFGTIVALIFFSTERKNYFKCHICFCTDRIYKRSI